MKKLLLNALKASSAAVAFALSIAGVSLNADDGAAPTLALAPQEEPVAIAAPASAPVAEQPTSLANSVIITAADDTNPTNIMEKLNAIRAMPFSKDRREAIFKMVRTTKNDVETYSAESKSLFKDILQAEVDSAALAGSQLSEIIKELYKDRNYALVSEETIRALHHKLDEADGKSRSARHHAHSKSSARHHKGHDEHQDGEANSSRRARRKKHHDAPVTGEAVEHNAMVAEHHEDTAVATHGKKGKKAKKNKSKKGNKHHQAGHHEETKTADHHEEKSSGKKKNKKAKKAKKGDKSKKNRQR